MGPTNMENPHYEEKVTQSFTGGANRPANPTLRMECLRMALSMHGEPHSHNDIVEAAKAFEAYITNKDQA